MIAVLMDSWKEHAAALKKTGLKPHLLMSSVRICMSQMLHDLFSKVTSFLKVVFGIRSFKGKLIQKMKMCWKCTHPQVIQDVDGCISSSDLEKCNYITCFH